MPKPIRLFEGSHDPHQPFWIFRDAAQSESGEPELEFYGFISEYSWFEDDITPRLFKDDLYKNGKGGPVTIRMNSGGGEVVAASVIRSILVDYPGQVTVRIDGLAASAATFVALAGDRILMQDTAYFMIHDPSALAWGTIEDIKQVLDLLKTIKGGMVDAYQAKTQLGAEKLARMMTDETWMSANEAKTYGFIDEVITTKTKVFPGAPAAKAAITNALRNYNHVPEGLLEQLRQWQCEPTEPENPNQAAGEQDAIRAKAQRLSLTRGTL